MERVIKLEGKVEDLWVDFAGIKANYATKEDVESARRELQSSLASQTKWLVSALFVVLGTGLGLAKLLF